MGHDELRVRHMSGDDLVRLRDEVAGGIDEIRKLVSGRTAAPVIQKGPSFANASGGRLSACQAQAGTPEPLVTRRGFLAGGATALGGVALGSLTGFLTGPRKALADTVRTGLFIFPRLQFAVYDESVDKWNIGPIGDVNLKKKLQELTNINVSPGPKVVRLGNFDEMVRHPFVFMTSEGYFRLAAQEEKNLREFLERGGFILADDCVLWAKEDRFFRCYRDLVNKLFPDNPMRPIPLDHEVFHIYYDFDRGCPHMQGVRAGRSNAYALFERGTGRIMTFATPGDLHCGWMCRFWGMPKNMQAIKMGINIIIYFLSH